jgi:hypothetical protein
MSMAEDLEALRQLKQDANMDDAIGQLAQVLIAIEHVIMGGEIALGGDHLGMVAINEAAGNAQGEVDRVHGALKHFEQTVKDVVDAVIQSLS